MSQWMLPTAYEEEVVEGRSMDGSLFDAICDVEMSWCGRSPLGRWLGQTFLGCATKSRENDPEENLIDGVKAILTEVNKYSKQVLFCLLFEK